MKLSIKCAKATVKGARIVPVLKVEDQTSNAKLVQTVAFHKQVWVSFNTQMSFRVEKLP